MAMTSNMTKVTVAHNLSIAFAVIGLVIGGEYFFRHYVLFWLPTIGTLMVNDMLALFLVYALLTLGLGLIMQVHWEQELVGVARALREGVSNWGFTIWVLALVLSLVVLSQVDYWLWGRLHLPMVVSSYRNSTVWLAGLASALKIVSRLVVNGLFVPVAEEYLWRGLVQVRLLRVFSVPVAIGLTAVFFSLKHALVDASLGRFLAIIAFGVICGVVAHRSNWKRSAAMHIVVNTMATLAGMLFGLG